MGTSRPGRAETATKSKQPAGAPSNATTRGIATAALADRLRQRSDARAARSVNEDLLVPSMELSTVTELVSTTPSLARASSVAMPEPDLGATGQQQDGRAAQEEQPLPTAVADAHDVAPTPAYTPREERPSEGQVTSRVPQLTTEREAESVTKPVAGPDGRLQLRGERLMKMTLELPVPLVDALARWERDEVVATGRRVYRERLIDCALTRLPENTDELVALARELPQALRTADTEQIGTRVRESVQRQLQSLRPELRVRRIRDVYLRHVYAAAIAQYLAALGISLEEQ